MTLQYVPSTGWLQFSERKEDGAITPPSVLAWRPAMSDTSSEAKRPLRDGGNGTETNFERLARREVAISLESELLGMSNSWTQLLKDVEAGEEIGSRRLTGVRLELLSFEETVTPLLGELGDVDRNERAERLARFGTLVARDLWEIALNHERGNLDAAAIEVTREDLAEVEILLDELESVAE